MSGNNEIYKYAVLLLGMKKR